MKKLKITYIPISEIKPYENNAKLHPIEQVEQIKESIKEFGFNDPIAIWGDDNTIIEGHGRYEAAKELSIDEIPVIRLDNLTDEERKAYTLIHNKLTMNSGFDFNILQQELDNLSDTDINMADFGFIDDDIDIDDMFAEAPQKDDVSESETFMIKCPHCGEMIEVDSKGNVVM